MVILNVAMVTITDKLLHVSRGITRMTWMYPSNMAHRVKKHSFVLDVGRATTAVLQLSSATKKPVPTKKHAPASTMSVMEVSPIIHEDQSLSMIGRILMEQAAWVHFTMQAKR
jgi:hypothetical protein